MTEHVLDSALPAAALGEAWALRAIYDHLAPQVHGYLRGRGAAEPEDLTSEVFLSVLPKLASVTGGAAGLRTFVFSVAHARLVDDFRRRSRRGATAEYAPEQDPRSVPSAEDDAIDSLQSQRVNQLLAELPADQRDVLLLRIIADLSLEQVAGILGKSTGAIKQLQRRGLLALRQRIGSDVTI